jgi:excisionase family DNA binding protein
VSHGAGGENAGGAREYLSVREVAALLGVHPSTIYDLCARGELSHVRVSNAIRIVATDFDRFARSRR